MNHRPSSSRKLGAPSTFARRIPTSTISCLFHVFTNSISIHLVRDERSGKLIILAGEEIEIEINRTARRTPDEQSRFFCNDAQRERMSIGRIR